MNETNTTHERRPMTGYHKKTTTTRSNNPREQRKNNNNMPKKIYTVGEQKPRSKRIDTREDDEQQTTRVSKKTHHTESKCRETKENRDTHTQSHRPPGVVVVEALTPWGTPLTINQGGPGSPTTVQMAASLRVPPPAPFPPPFPSCPPFPPYSQCLLSAPYSLNQGNENEGHENGEGVKWIRRNKKVCVVN